jgi:hypothetical protein
MASLGAGCCWASGSRLPRPFLGEMAILLLGDSFKGVGSPGLPLIGLSKKQRSETPERIHLSRSSSFEAVLLKTEL